MKAGAEMAPLPIAAQVSAVLVPPATGASALALAAVTRLPEVTLPETAVEFASPLAPWPIAVAGSTGLAGARADAAVAAVTARNNQHLVAVTCHPSRADRRRRPLPTSAATVRKAAEDGGTTPAGHDCPRSEIVRTCERDRADAAPPVLSGTSAAASATVRIQIPGEVGAVRCVLGVVKGQSRRGRPGLAPGGRAAISAATADRLLPESQKAARGRSRHRIGERARGARPAIRAARTIAARSAVLGSAHVGRIARGGCRRLACNATGAASMAGAIAVAAHAAAVDCKAVGYKPTTGRRSARCLAAGTRRRSASPLGGVAAIATARIGISSDITGTGRRAVAEAVPPATPLGALVDPFFPPRPPKARLKPLTVLGCLNPAPMFTFLPMYVIAWHGQTVRCLPSGSQFIINETVGAQRV
jgi:hypothetical protein